ncbi:hypothetical protein BJ912DRAFT_979015 [Pholiota molesta]|nr:hypothetical protein BJ912DRAFT_979015 [Pholiota molesta]
MAPRTSVNEKPSIPLDVIETIIDILVTLDDHGLSSVRTCSLTCRSFLHFCRKHIFASVSLDIGKTYASIPHPTSAQFQKLLITAPEIAKYVRKLSFGVPPYQSWGGFFNVVNLAEVLMKFDQVQQLTIGSINTFEAINWSKLPFCLQDAVFHLLDLPTIDYLILIRISHFRVSDLTRCSNLRRLRVEFFKDPVLDQISPTLHPRSVVLEEYSMGWQSCEAMEKVIALEWPNGQPVFDFRQLKKYSAPYELRWGDTAIELTRGILKQTDQLASICLQCCVANLSESGFSDTIRHSLGSLRRIDLHCFLLNDTWCHLIGFPDQLKMMRKWPNILEELGIHIRPQTYTSLLKGTEEQWGFELDESLNDSGWSSLKKVSITIGVLESLVLESSSGTNFDSAFREVHQTQFPFLSSNKAITFNFNIVYITD